MRLRTVSAILAVLLCVFSMTGCTSARELKQEAIVEGVGIDKDKNGQYSFTVQIYKPKQGSGGGDKPSQGQNEIFECTGKSLFDGVRNMSLIEGRQLFFSNCRAYVLGGSVAAENLTYITDFMSRNQDIKPGENIYFTSGSARKILEAKKDDEIVPAENIQLESKNYSLSSETVNVSLSDLFITEATGVTDPILPYVEIKKDTMKNDLLSMGGCGVFHNGKLAGLMNKTETRGYLFTKGEVKNGDLTFNVQGGKVTTEIVGNGSKVKVSSDKGKPVITVDIDFESNITEIESVKTKSVDTKYLYKVIQAQDKLVKSEAQSAVNTTFYKYGADIFGFGMDIYEQKPELWRKIMKSWKTRKGETVVKINVQSSLRHYGLINK